MTFLERIDALIAEKGINRNTVAKEIDGLNHSSFYTWEKRGTVPSAEILSKIADYFNVSTDYLLGKTDEPKPIDEVHDEVDEYLDILHKRGDMRMLFSVAKDATKEDIEIAAKIIEDLIKRQRGEE